MPACSFCVFEPLLTILSMAICLLMVRMRQELYHLFILGLQAAEWLQSGYERKNWKREWEISIVHHFIWSGTVCIAFVLTCCFFCTVDHHNGRLSSSWSHPQMCLEADCPLAWNDNITPRHATSIFLFKAESCAQIRHGDAPVRSQSEPRSSHATETCDLISCEETVLSSPRTMRSSCTLQWITACIKCYHSSSRNEHTHAVVWKLIFIS